MMLTVLFVMFIVIVMSSSQQQPRRYMDIINRDFQRICLSLSPSFMIIKPKNVNAVSSIPVASILDQPKYKKSLFNLIPIEMTYPDYFLGDWNVKYQFDGAGFGDKIAFDQLSKDPNVAGFRKYSIAYMSDIGKDVNTSSRYIKRNDGAIVEDLDYNIKSIVEIQQKSVNCRIMDFNYDPGKNPNRLGFKYTDDKGNGNIELFINDRKKNIVENNFYSISNLRQSSVRRREDLISSNGGLKYAASQILCDYAIELSLTHTDDDQMNGIFRIFSYLQPQDSMYFIVPDQPVAFFQYQVFFTRKT